MKILPALFGALMLGGCVYSDALVLDSRTVIISDRGNAFARREQVLKRVLLDSAKVTLAHGYTHFVIVNAQDTTWLQTLHVDGSFAPITARSTSETFAGQTTTTTRFEGGSYSPPTNQQIAHPGQRFTIRMYQASDPEAAKGFNAREVITMNGGHP